MLDALMLMLVVICLVLAASPVQLSTLNLHANYTSTNCSSNI